MPKTRKIQVFGILVCYSNSACSLLILTSIDKLVNSTFNSSLKLFAFEALTFYDNFHKVFLDVEERGQGRGFFSTMLLIGAKIQEYRKKQGLSQEEFAAEVGVTRQAVSKWETDKAYPDLDKLVSICDILQIGITDLIYGEIVATFEDSAGQLPERPGAAAESPLEMKGIAVGKVRGKEAYLRLWVMLALIGGMFLFCGALLATMLTHYSWKKEDALAERVRVERVHQQYTKADVSFFDDVSRRVVKTVWLDINGIREGDSLICYTDGEQKGIYYEYHGATLFVLAAVELVFLFLFLIAVGEFKRLVRENRWHVLADEAKDSLRQVAAKEAKEKGEP